MSLSDYTIDELAADIASIEAVIAEQTGWLADRNAELANRFSGALSNKLNKNTALSGSLEVDGHKIKGSISKSVKWDSDKLQRMASIMGWDEIQHYFKITFSMSETVFKGMLPGPLQEEMAAARTVKYGDLKVSLVPPKT